MANKKEVTDYIEKLGAAEKILFETLAFDQTAKSYAFKDSERFKGYYINWLEEIARYNCEVRGIEYSLNTEETLQKARNELTDFIKKEDKNFDNSKETLQEIFVTKKTSKSLNKEQKTCISFLRDYIKNKKDEGEVSGIDLNQNSGGVFFNSLSYKKNRDLLDITNKASSQTPLDLNLRTKIFKRNKKVFNGFKTTKYPATELGDTVVKTEFGIYTMAIRDDKKLTIGMEIYDTLKNLKTSQEFNPVSESMSEQYDIYRIDSVSGRNFERLILNLLPSLDYDNARLTPKTGDMGGDIIAEKNQETIVFQVKSISKNSNKKSCGVKALRETTSAIENYSADRGILVCNRQFTSNVNEEAKRSIKTVELWDRAKITEIVHDSHFSPAEFREIFRQLS